MAAGNNAAGRDMVPLLIVLSGIFALLAGPLFGTVSIVWAQQQSAYRLVGTIEGGPFTGAVIDDTKNPQAFYRLNEKLPDESQIVKVKSDSVVLKWPDGTRTELFVTQGARGGSVSAVSVAAMPSAPARLANPSAGSGQESAGRWTPRTGRPDPNQQGAQVQDPGTRKKGAAGRRIRPRSNVDD